MADEGTWLDLKHATQQQRDVIFEFMDAGAAMQTAVNTEDLISAVRKAATTIPKIEQLDTPEKRYMIMCEISASFSRQYRRITGHKFNGKKIVLFPN